MQRNLVGLILLLALTAACSEVQESAYASYGEAKQQGAVGRGLVPTCVPHSATNIRETHDLDTNEQWIVFDGLIQPDKSWVLIQSNQVDSVLARHPTGISWWPRELTNEGQASEPFQPLYEVVSPTGRRCVVTSSKSTGVCWCGAR